MTCIVFGSSMGNTENAANQIAAKLDDDVTLVNVTDMTADSFSGCDRVLLGSSTWGVGDLQDDWETGIETLKSIDFSGMKVGFFGCGDQDMYPDSFVDALGTLHDAVKGTASEIIGAWPVDGYDFAESAAVVGGKFIGLPLDEDNQSDRTEARISDWVATL